MYLRFLVAVVERTLDLTLLGSSTDGRQAFALLRAQTPQLALLDQDLPRYDGVALLREIERDRLCARVVIISGVPATRRAYDAIVSGAAGYITRDFAEDEIASALLTVAAGGVVLAREIRSDLVDAFRARRTRPDAASRDAENQFLLELLAEGRTLAEITAELNVSSAAVQARVEDLCESLGVSTPTAAAIEAVQRGLIKWPIPARERSRETKARRGPLDRPPRHPRAHSV